MYSERVKNQTCLALDIGATNIKYAVVGSEASISDLKIVPTQKSRGPDGLVDQIADIYQSLLKDTHLSKSLLPAIGICAAGPLDPVGGRLLEPANLTDGSEEWKNFSLVEKIQDRLNIKVKLENDAAAAALAEYWVGEERQVSHLVTLALGTGLGVGVVRSGEVFRTPDNLHPELGHSIVSFESDEKSSAKIQGSLESIVGPKFFLENFSKTKGSSFDGKQFVELYRSGDSEAQAAVRVFYRALLAGLFNFYLSFGPEKFIFQGGFTPLLEPLLEPLKKELSEKLKAFLRPGDLGPEIAISKISRTCGVYGAAYGIFKTLT